MTTPNAHNAYVLYIDLDKPSLKNTESKYGYALYNFSDYLQMQ